MAQRYNLIHFGKCPSFSEIFEIAKSYFVVKTCEDGQYAIVIELTANGKVNYGII